LCTANRVARNGQILTSHGPLSIKKKQYEEDFNPPDPDCSCQVCQKYTRSYLRHLFRNGEILSSMLLSYHNLYFLEDMVRKARTAIEKGILKVLKLIF
jgi:queuine tRNA-ribosyltransferase